VVAGVIAPDRYPIGLFQGRSPPTIVGVAGYRIGELATRSEEFKTRWAAHDVPAHRRGTKHVHHRGGRRHAPSLRGSGDHQRGRPHPLGYTAEPGDTASQDALLVLASWAATDDDQDATKGATSEPVDPGRPEHTVSE
jgi:MmyB-like transcription regulator ligand binding domain